MCGFVVIALFTQQVFHLCLFLFQLLLIPEVVVISNHIWCSGHDKFILKIQIYPNKIVVHAKFWKSQKVLYQSFDLNVQTIVNSSINVSLITVFLPLFQIINNFGFFQLAIELIHKQIHLTSFIEFTMMLNQRYKQLFEAEQKRKKDKKGGVSPHRGLFIKGGSNLLLSMIFLSYYLIPNHLCLKSTNTEQKQFPLIRVLSKHFCLQLFFPKDSISLLYAQFVGSSR